MEYFYCRHLEDSLRDLSESQSVLAKKEARISQLENEVFVYQENYKLLSDQLREVQQTNQELRYQVNYFMNELFSPVYLNKC